MTLKQKELFLNFLGILTGIYCLIFKSIDNVILLARHMINYMIMTTVSFIINQKIDTQYLIKVAHF